MKAVIQRSQKAFVSVEGETIGSIDHGLVIFLGVSKDDDESHALRLAEKISKLRIFTDRSDKMNLSVNDINGKALIISNFTINASCRHGNRPDFGGAEKPEKAKQLYEYFIDLLGERIAGGVAHGSFGADMSVFVENDGPVTIVIDSNELAEIKK